MPSSALSAIRLVAVGSTNPVKIAACRRVLETVVAGVNVEGVAVASQVADQPFGDEETIRGAITRAKAARAALDADLGGRRTGQNMAKVPVGILTNGVVDRQRAYECS